MRDLGCLTQGERDEFQEHFNLAQVRLLSAMQVLDPEITIEVFAVRYAPLVRAIVEQSLTASHDNMRES